MNKLSFEGSGGSELPPSPSPSGEGIWEEGVVGVNSRSPPPPPGRVSGRREWWESTPALPLPLRGGYLGGGSGGSQLPPSPSPSGEGIWEEGVVGVKSCIAKLLNRFVLVKKKRDTQKTTQTQHLAAVTIVVLRLVMLNFPIRFLSIIFFRRF